MAPANVELKDKLKTKEMYSFDIFDTLLARMTAYPCGIFSIMEKIMSEDKQYFDIDKNVRNNFAIIRSTTERYCRSNNYYLYKNHEILFDDIYNQIRDNYCLSEEQISRMKNLEFETELKNLVPIKKNVDLIKQYIDEQKPVVIISDMYFSAEMLRKIFEHKIPEIVNVPIFVSCECKKNKTNKELFMYVHKQLGIDYKNWHHFGDNIKSDIKCAKVLGIHSHHLKQEDFFKYEEELLNFNKFAFYPQVIIGCAKLARTLSEDKSSAYKFGCSFSAPILYNYVNWVINDAITKGFKTLHFVARDGFILKEIADVIIQQKKLAIKTKYVYGSRKAWRIPDENSIDSLIKTVFASYRGQFNLNFLAERFDISPEIFNQYAQIPKHRKLQEKEIDALEAKLLASSKFKEKIVKVLEDKKELLIKYVEQAFDTSDKKIAIVDINGTGRTQDIFAKTLQAKYSNLVITGYYFNKDFKSMNNSISLKYGYLSIVSNVNIMLELLCRNMDGQTIGYYEENNTIKVKLEKINKELLEKWGYFSYIKGVRDYAKIACNFEILNDISLNSYYFCKYYFDYYKLKPDKELADRIGSVPFNAIGNEVNAGEFAPKYSIKDLPKLLTVGKVGFCYPLSYVRSSLIYKFIIKFNTKFGSLLKFFVDFRKSEEHKRAYIRILGIKVSVSRFVWRRK